MLVTAFVAQIRGIGIMKGIFLTNVFSMVHLTWGTGWYGDLYLRMLTAF